MATAQNGDKVLFNYVGRLDDGTVFDSTLASDCSDDDCSSDDCGCCHEPGPVEAVIGSGDFFPGLETALVGMAPGERKTLVIPFAEAFGEYDETKVFTVPLSDLPEDFAAEEGDELVLSGDDDEEIGVYVLEKTDEAVTFDANHPLAGNDLTFDLELVAIG